MKKNGVIGGLLLAGLMIGTFYLSFAGLTPLQIWLIKFVTIGVFLCFFLITLRGQKSFFSYHDARRTSFFAVGVMALGIGLFNMIYFKWINPEFLLENINYNVEEMRKEGRSALEIEEMVDKYKFWMSPYMYGIQKFIAHLLIGLLLAFMNSYIIGDRSGKPAEAPETI